MDSLQSFYPALSEFAISNKYGLPSIDFSNPKSVKALNKALLLEAYDIDFWDFPNENLTPPIPGRSDYIHYMADVLKKNNGNELPVGDKITCLDIGVGASCIYPIIGVMEYNWNFIGSEVDTRSMKSAKNIANSNQSLKGKIEFRMQSKPADAFHGLIGKEEKIDLTICNPPFHSSKEEAVKGTRRKVKNLSGKSVKSPELNFAGISAELICDGGEHKFIHNMIRESEKFSNNCLWFSTLVSKQSNLKGIENALKEFKAKEVVIIPMGTGNKSTRIVAWTFLTQLEQKDWVKSRW